MELYLFEVPLLGLCWIKGKPNTHQSICGFIMQRNLSPQHDTDRSEEVVPPEMPETPVDLKVHKIALLEGMGVDAPNSSSLACPEGNNTTNGDLWYSACKGHFEQYPRCRWLQYRPTIIPVITLPRAQSMQTNSILACESSRACWPS